MKFGPTRWFLYIKIDIEHPLEKFKFNSTYIIK